MAQMAFAKPAPRSFYDGSGLEYSHDLYDRSVYDTYGARYGTYTYGTPYGAGYPYEEYDPRMMTRRPNFGYAAYYQNPAYRSHRPIEGAAPAVPAPVTGEVKYRDRLTQLERQAWAQAQIIREQFSLLESMRDPRGGLAYNYSFPQRGQSMPFEPRGTGDLNLPRRQQTLKKKEPRGKADPRLTEKRAQAKQFKTFIRTHFTVRAAFRFVEYFLTGEDKAKFNADTRPYLNQFSEELKRPKNSIPLPTDKKTTSAPTSPTAVKTEGTKEFFDIATRHMRLVVEAIKNHPRYLETVAENKDHEKSIDAAMADNQEGRICMSRLMIYAITAFGIQGKTRLHQIANLLQELEINLEQDPDLVTAILAEAESRAKNYQQFCHAAVKTDPTLPVPTAAPAEAPASHSLSPVIPESRSLTSVPELTEQMGKVALTSTDKNTGTEAAK